MRRERSWTDLYDMTRPPWLPLMSPLMGINDNPVPGGFLSRELRSDQITCACVTSTTHTHTHTHTKVETMSSVDCLARAATYAKRPITQLVILFLLFWVLLGRLTSYGVIVSRPDPVVTSNSSPILG